MKNYRLEIIVNGKSKYRYYMSMKRMAGSMLRWKRVKGIGFKLYHLSFGPCNDRWVLFSDSMWNTFKKTYLKECDL